MSRLDDFAANFDQVLGRTTAWTQGLGGATELPIGSEASASDPAEVVTVTVSGSGRLQRVEVSATWKTKGEVDLAAAITTANAIAVSRAFGVEPDLAAMQSFDVSTVDEQIERMRQDAMVDLGTEVAPEDDVEVLRQRAGISSEQPTPALLVAQSAQLRRLTADLDSGVILGGSAVAEERLDDGYVALQFGNGGMLTAVDVNDRWAHGQSGNALTMRIDELLNGGTNAS